MDRLGLADLGIRRVSDISHINEIRNQVFLLRIFTTLHLHIIFEFMNI